LVRLQLLKIGQNNFRLLPEWIEEFIQLQDLDVFGNKLTSLPVSIGKLRQLKNLSIDGNQITDLPESFVNLVDIEVLIMGDGRSSGNPFNKFPRIVRSFKKLSVLEVSMCNLDSLPDWLSDLKEIKEIWAYKNQFIDIPPSLAQLEHLKYLNLDNNPLNPALQSAYNAGLDTVKAYLRSLEQNAEPLYEAKLVLVGEGNVGKTTLLKALKGKAGEAPQEHEPTTHGVEIDIHGLRLPHPAKDGVEIQLNAWDFGGQDVYRVTHQFFFSRRSLYLLVWEPRRGVQQGQVEDWLNMIRLRVGDEARVIIVSTHCKTGERIARIDQPVFKAQYGDMIVGFHEVDSLVPDPATGEMTGIAELKKVIASEASKLKQMGMGFNRDWKAARDELLARPEPRISFSTFSGVCAASP
jgi:GTPase SAR1 family protein